MKKHLGKIATLLLFVSVFIALEAQAAELRVVDSVGLIRASHSVSSNGTVSIAIAARDHNTDFPADITLISQDGLASDVKAIHKGNGQYEVSGVPSGTWKIAPLSGAGSKSFEIHIVKIF